MVEDPQHLEVVKRRSIRAGLVIAGLSLVVFAAVLGLVQRDSGNPTASRAATNSASTTSSAVTTNTTVPFTLPASLKGLLSAPVPALCEHPAGRLVDGSLPGVPEGQGGVWLSAAANKNSAAIAVGDLDKEPGDEIAAVVSCNQGGVAWPDTVQIYGDDFHVAGQPEPRGPRGGLQRTRIRVGSGYDQGTIHVRWYTGQQGDCGGCQTLAAETHIRPTGNTYRAEDTRTYPEMDAVRALIRAVAEGDDATIRKLATNADIAQALKRDLVGSQGDGNVVCHGGLDNYDGSIAFDSPSIEGLRFCRVDRQAAPPAELGLSPANQPATEGAFGTWHVTGIHEL